MPSTVKIIIIAAFYLLCPIAAFPETLNADRVQLSEAYHALITNVHEHKTQMLEPYTKGLLDQTLAVKIQMSDFVRKMGCPDEKEPETLCLVLVMEEKRLEAELVTEALKWYDFEKEKTANGKPHVETKQKDGGWAGVLTVAR